MKKKKELLSQTQLPKEFCVIIPTKNEVGTLGEIIDEVRQYTENIIIVDGHSDDGTLAIAKEKGVTFIFDNQKGKGDALRVGVAHADKDIIVFIDADGSHEISDIPKLIEPIQKGQADLMVGSRIRGGSDELHGTFNKFIRNTGTNFLAVLVTKKWKTEISDIENGFRAIRRDVFNFLNLTSNGFTIEQEMVLKCLKNNFRILEIPSHEYNRKSGRSKLRTIKGFKFLLHFFKECYF